MPDEDAIVIPLNLAPELSLISAGMMIPPKDWNKIVAPFLLRDKADCHTNYQWTWSSPIGKVTLQYVPAIHYLFAYRGEDLITRSAALGPIEDFLDQEQRKAFDEEFGK